jgi:outer membrane lipoprotein-sorting protein
VSPHRFPVKSLCLWLSLACLVFVPASCAIKAPKPVSLAELPTAPQAVERLNERRRYVRSFAMQGEIRLEGDRGEVSGEHIIQGAYPNRLRAEVMGPFNRPVLLLISDGRWLAVLDYRENKAFLGQASQRNLARFLGLDLSMESIYALLSGSMIVAPGAGNIRLTPAAQPGLARLQLGYMGGVVDQELFFDPASYSLQKAMLKGRGGSGTLEAAFSDFQKGTVYSYPLHIELKDRSDRTVVLSCDELRINPPLADDVFTPRLPKGVPVELLP